MPKKSKKKPIALDAYEKMAERYAAMVDTKDYNAYYERPATLSLLPDVSGKNILDAGCGSGSYSSWLIEHGANVVAVDISPRMLEFAKKRLGNKAEIYLANLEKPLDFLPDESFDMVLSPLVFDYIEDWSGLFAECNRLLKPSGLLIYSVGHPFNEHLLHEGSEYYKVEFVKRPWTSLGIEVEVPYFRRSLESMIDPLIEAGFLIEKILEPGPTQMLKEKSPELYKRISNLPVFVCIRAKKK